MNKFRALKADEIECRTAQVKPKGISLLLYKTARTDANLLDETVGPENWENDFKVVDGVLYGGIGIYIEDKDRWVWKWDAGSESNTEAQKGEASDSFKRAGFNWGIGRELYTCPLIWFPAANCNVQGNKCYDYFAVEAIEYSDGKISYIKVVNTKTGAVCAKGKSELGLIEGDEIASKAEREYIRSKLEDPDAMAGFLDYYGIDSLEDLTVSQYVDAFQRFQKEGRS